jgi:RES domain-containing protein
MRLWRIAGAHHPIWSGEGARLNGARWNPPGLPAIYAGTSYAIAALEIIVHANGDKLPENLVYVEITLPEGAAIERADPAGIKNWSGADMAATRAYGKTWLLADRSLALLVPSVVTRGLDWNAVINPHHPDFTRIIVTPVQQVVWDTRLGREESP